LLRYLVLKNQNFFVQKSTLRRIQMVPDCLVAGAPTTPTGQSTTSQLVSWLRSQSQDETIGIRYTVLFRKLLGGNEFHKFLKGRLLAADCVPLQVVNENL
jgi:hypothetical protein